VKPDHLVPHSAQEQASLPVKITVIVFWGMVLVGLIGSFVLLHNLDQTINERLEGAADRIAYRVSDYLDKHPGATHDEIENTLQSWVSDHTVSGMTLRFESIAVTIGQTDPAGKFIERTTLHHRMNQAGHALARLTLYLPNVDGLVAVERKKILTVLGVTIMVFGFVLQWILKKVLTQPFQDMTRTATAVMAGNVDQRFNEQRTDEFGFLARFMNRALDTLAQHQQEKLRQALDRAQASEDALHAEKERAVVTLHSIGDAVITTDASGIIEYLNPMAEHLTGCTAASAHGSRIDKLLCLFEEATRTPVENPVTRCLRDSKAIESNSNVVLVRPDRREIDIAHSVAPIRSRDNHIIGAVLVLRDVSNTRRLARELAHQANHDALTGVYNRRAFAQRLQQALDEGIDQSARTLCYLDMDQFKAVNDTCGHAAGDDLLCQFAALLRAHVRESGIIARLGGDEFGILLDRCDEENAVRLMTHLLARIQEFRFAWQERAFTVGASIGLVTLAPGRYRDITDIMRAADTACYTAKKSGRNRLHIYRPDDSSLLRHPKAG